MDQQEYSTGRLIGLLERIFVFLFVLLNQYAAIGFILAAKGVARFQDFKSRTFAEYVLIGTLLSALLAMDRGFCCKRRFDAWCVALPKGVGDCITTGSVSLDNYSHP